MKKIQTNTEFGSFSKHYLRSFLCVVIAAVLLVFPAVGESGYPPGNCVEFSSAGAGLRDNSVDDYDILNVNKNLTVEAWVRADSITTTPSEIFRFATNTDWDYDGGYVFHIENEDGEDRLEFFYRDDDSESHRVYTLFEAGEWHHVAATMDGNAIDLYIDGIHAAHNIVDELIDDGGDDRYMYIGKNLHGAIDELRAWTKALTESEIRERMNSVCRGDEDDLALYLRFDERSDIVIGGTTAGYYFEDLTGKHTYGKSNIPIYLPFEAHIQNVASDALIDRIPTVGTGSMEAPGNALNFDGENEYVDCGDFEALQGDVSYTKEAWIKLADDSGTKNIVSGYGDHALYVADGGYLEALNGTGNWLEDTDPMDIGVWYHVAVAYDADTDTATLYKNGDIVASETGWAAPTDDRMLIGSYDETNFFAGQIDEVRIWAVARTQEEILQNMNRPLTGDETGLLAYYSFDHPEGFGLGNFGAGRGNTGLLFNMEDEDWVPSGADISDVQETGWVYFDKDGRILEDPTEDDIRQSAVRRFHMTAGVNEYALVIDMDHSDGKGDGASDTFANPDPAFGKSWIPEGETISCSVNGIVLETNNINLRYVVSGYYATGPPNTSGSSDPHFYGITLEDLNDDDLLAVPDFVMDAWAKIEYKWKSQYRISVSTLPAESVSHLPLTEVTDASGQDPINGSGVQWYNKGTVLKFSSTDGCLELAGYKIIEENAVDVTPGTEFTKTVDQNYTVVWEYETPSYEETVTVGSPVAFLTVPVEYRDKLLAKPSVVKNVNDPNEDPEYLYVWNAAESKLFPTVGDRELQLEYPMGQGDCFDKMVVRVAVSWPESSHYVFTAGTDPVSLDPFADDSIRYMDIKYATDDAAVSSEKQFSADRSGRASLYFSASHIPDPAMHEVSFWFDGIDDYVDCGDILSDSYAIQAWIRPESGSGRFDIASGSSHRAFYVENGQLRAAHKDESGTWSVAYGPSLSVGQWQQVAVSYNHITGTLQLYRNGSPGGSATVDPPGGDDSVFIGALNKNANHFAGQIDEVAFWDTDRNPVYPGPISPYIANLVAYYKMDRAGESYLHDSGQRGYHATMQNMAPHLDTVHLLFRNPDGNYVDLPPLYSSGDLTVEGWVLVENHIASGVFLDFRDGGNNNPVYLWLSDGTSGRPRFGASSSITSSESIPLNVWTHVAATLQGGSARIYINGVETASGDIGAPANTTRSNSYMGGKPSGNTSDALFQEVRIWSTARSQENIVASMNASLSGVEGDLLALYRTAAENRGSTFFDSSDNGRDADLVDWRYPSSWVVDTAATAAPAVGDEGTESTVVRAVRIKSLAESQAGGEREAVIGRELASILHDPDATPPQIFYPRSRYNTSIYQSSGQIFPVNRQFTPNDEEDDLLIIWRRTRDGISWPENSVKYSCVWPADSKRIVIASRYGSESKTTDGTDPKYPDGEGSFKNWFDPARYSQLSVYYQNDPSLPGYNPNEEHALVAPSFRYSSAAPGPRRHSR